MTAVRTLFFRQFLAFLSVLGLVLLHSSEAAAQSPGVSVGGKAGTSGVGGSADGRGKGSGFKLPPRVAQGNAISLLMPVQVGFTNYMPRVRIGFQYDRQIYKSHWAYIGIAGLFDRGDFKTFKLSNCGLGEQVTTCNKGAVAGFDIYAGYAHKWFLRDHPYLVPIARGGIGGGWWKLPALRGSRQQARESSWTLNLRGGGGVRLFLLTDLALGVDLNFVIGFMRSRDVPLAMPVTKATNFVLGMEILPLIVEYRF